MTARQSKQSDATSGEAGSRFALAFSAMAIGALLLLLLDRIGAPQQLLLILAQIFGLVLLLVVGLALRSMQVSRFYAGGRLVSPGFAGMALAGIAVALGLGTLGPLAGIRALAVVGAQLTLGLLLASVFCGPILRKSGAYSVIGLAGARFPGASFRLALIVLISLLLALTGLACLQLAIGHLRLATGLGAWPGACILGIIVAAATVPGGLRGSVWVNVAAAACALGAFATSLWLARAQQMPLPLPLVGDRALMLDALSRLGGFGGMATDDADVGFSAIAPGFGYAVLFTCTGLFVTVPSPGKAARAGAFSLAWAAILALLICAMISLSVLGLEAEVIGARPERLSDAAYHASSIGELKICGQRVATPPDAQAACSKTSGFVGILQPKDISPDLTGLVAGLALVRHPPAAPAAFILTALAMLQAAAACAAVQALASGIAHEGFYHLRNRAALTSRRLAIARLGVLMTSALGIFICASFAPDPGWLLKFALLLAGGLAAPLLALLVWPLARTRDATLALALGGIATLVRGPGVLAGYEDFGSSLLALATITFATGILASLFHRKGAPRTSFLAALWRRGGEILPADRGA